MNAEAVPEDSGPSDVQRSTHNGAIHFSIASQYGNVSLVTTAIRALCHGRFGLEAAGQLELCAAEAITNAIEHAYKGEEGHHVGVRLLLEDERLVLEVYDQGNSMDPNLLAVGTGALEFDPDDIDNLPEGGMGLALIRMSADELEYHTKDGVNCLRLTRNFGE
ncbi:MAG: ATP-binding protein [Gammaproteobacteria bacterium]|nr:ATP-binding protein [Gammaproteobacteria bacterium]